MATMIWALSLRTSSIEAELQAMASALRFLARAAHTWAWRPAIVRQEWDDNAVGGGTPEGVAHP